MFKKLSKVNSLQIGENSPNLVTLLVTRIGRAGIESLTEERIFFTFYFLAENDFLAFIRQKP
jgi:hypothetical protein